MAITKKGVEKCLADMDSMIKQIMEKKGMFSYDSKHILDKWSYLRRELAYCAANILAGNVKDGKIVIKPNMYPSNPVNVEENVKAKSIELNKSEAVKEPQILIKIEG